MVSHLLTPKSCWVKTVTIMPYYEGGEKVGGNAIFPIAVVSNSKRQCRGYFLKILVSHIVVKPTFVKKAAGGYVLSVILNCSHLCKTIQSTVEATISCWTAVILWAPLSDLGCRMNPPGSETPEADQSQW